MTAGGGSVAQDRHPLRCECRLLPFAPMHAVNQALLFFHFLGLALGFSVSFGNAVMSGLIARATPPEKAVLGRFPPAISQVGRAGLVLLWLTGAAMVFTKWNGFAALPWTFYVKLAAVVVLTASTEYIRRLQRQVQQGDASAIARIEPFGKLATAMGLTSVLFAVLTFS